jgi:hypothetical protein
MPLAPDDDALAEEFDRDLLEMEDNWYLRQENILPLETAWNEGRFYGLLLKGNQPFTPFQRLGIFLTGLQLLEFGSLPFIIGQGLHPAGPSLRLLNERLPNISLVWVPVFLLEIALGLRICWVALKRPPERERNVE